MLSYFAFLSLGVQSDALQMLGSQTLPAKDPCIINCDMVNVQQRIKGPHSVTTTYCQEVLSKEKCNKGYLWESYKGGGIVKPCHWQDGVCDTLKDERDWVRGCTVDPAALCSGEKDEARITLDKVEVEGPHEAKISSEKDEANITLDKAADEKQISSVALKKRANATSSRFCTQCTVETYAHGTTKHSKRDTTVGAGIFNYNPLSDAEIQGLSYVVVKGDGCLFEGFSEANGGGTVICKMGEGSYNFRDIEATCPNDKVWSWEVTCAAEANHPPPTTCDDPGTCTVAEDPHVEVFDGRFVSLLAKTHSHRLMNNGHAGDKWLVKSKAISIQARYMPNDDLPDRNLFVRAIAVGGEFLKGNKMIITALEEESKWNTETILEYADSSFRFQKGDLFVDAVRGEHSLLVQNLTKENRGVTINLPLGVNLVVNRLRKHVNVAIRMCGQKGGQEGVCGNFNGISADDSLELSARRFDTDVSPAESLFPESM